MFTLNSMITLVYLKSKKQTHPPHYKPFEHFLMGCTRKQRIPKALCKQYLHISYICICLFFPSSFHFIHHFVCTLNMANKCRCVANVIVCAISCHTLRRFAIVRQTLLCHTDPHTHLHPRTPKRRHWHYGLGISIYA